MAETENKHPRERLENCVATGIAMKQLAGYNEITWYPVNVRGLVKESELIVPHSELAMHTGAAGKQILAWSLADNNHYAYVSFDDEGHCRMTHGAPSEVLPQELLKLMEKMQAG